jgi:hypothetical protein
MIHDVWTTIVPKQVGEEIIIAKVPQGTAPSGWQARRIINAVRTTVPLEQLTLEVVVVMDSEPHEQPTVLGSSPAAETFVRSIASQLAAYRWRLTKVRW